MAQFDPQKLQRAFALVDEGVGRAYAGAVAAVGDAGGIGLVKACGYAAVDPHPVPMTEETLFDLASLTKVVATTPAVLGLLEEGTILLETPLQHILPQFGDARVTLRHLLTHTSGLPAWLPLYLDWQGWEAYVDAICRAGLVRDPGVQVEYSDLGFILLGAVVQRLTGKSLPEYCRATIFEPLGMSHTGWLPDAPQHTIAATEVGNQIEYGMCKERAGQFTRWRREVIWGQTNDGNAWYGLDGVSSHAGLFSTAQDLGRYAGAWLSGGWPVLAPRTVALATRSHTPGLNENRGLGWQKPPHAAFPTGRYSCGDLLSPSAYGHTGFTGTSLWIDPEEGFFVLLLTNRLHPAPNDAFYHLRPAFHNAVAASLR